ncbi:MAG: IclR family transcriptional regulator [Rhodobacteraceae bacterium]|nr:IclR family transcriptional regulator [Paracoccaceae bacterium]
MSTLSRTLSLIDLFSADRLFWTVEDLCEATGYNRATVYRYVRDLVSFGFLVRTGDGHYSLGPRIVELDHLIRRSDPFLIAGQPVAEDLANLTGADINLCALFGEQIVTVLQHGGAGGGLPLTFGRGRRLPLLRGAGSKIIVANFTPTQIARVFAAEGPGPVARLGCAPELPAFRALLARWRKAGFAESEGELDPGYASAAVPVFTPDGRILGSIAAAMSRERFELVRTDRMVEVLKQGAQRITSGLLAVGWPVAPGGKAAQPISGARGGNEGASGRSGADG